MQSSVTLGIQLYFSNGGHDEAVLVTVSCGAHQQILDYTTLPVEEFQQVTLPLDTAELSEVISITVSREGAVSQTYTIRLEKLPAVETEFQVSPADAVVF